MYNVLSSKSMNLLYTDFKGELLRFYNSDHTDGGSCARADKLSLLMSHESVSVENEDYKSENEKILKKESLAGLAHSSTLPDASILMLH